MYMEANIEFSFSITQQIWMIMLSSFIFGDSKAPGNYPRKILRISSYKMLLKSNYIARHLHCVKHALQCTVLWQIYGKHLVPGSVWLPGRPGRSGVLLSQPFPSEPPWPKILLHIWRRHTHTRSHFILYLLSPKTLLLHILFLLLQQFHGSLLAGERMGSK